MGKEAQDARNFNAPVEEHELKERYEKYKRILAGLTIMSDIFMRNVLKKAGMHRVYFANHYGQRRFGSEGADSAEGL